MRYTFRCPIHGEFDVYQSMQDTRPSYPCPLRHRYPSGNEALGVQCAVEAPKVFSVHVHYPYGRETFHDGTVRERAEQTLAQARSEGLDPVPVSNADLSQRHDAGHGRVFYDGTDPRKEQKQKIRKAAKKAMENPTGSW